MVASLQCCLVLSECTEIGDQLCEDVASENLQLRANKSMKEAKEVADKADGICEKAWTTNEVWPKYVQFFF